MVATVSSGRSSRRRPTILQGTGQPHTELPGPGVSDATLGTLVSGTQPSGAWGGWRVMSLEDLRSVASRLRTAQAFDPRDSPCVV